MKLFIGKSCSEVPIGLRQVMLENLELEGQLLEITSLRCEA